MKSFLKIIRPLNLFILASTQYLMSKAVIAPILELNQLEVATPWWALILLIVGTVLITMGGYIINDYFDTRIDEINKPHKVVIGKAITRHKAMKLHQLITGLGTACGLIISWHTKSAPVALVFIAVPGLLWFYSSTYKRQFLVGNLVVSIITALAPLLVSLIEVSYLVNVYGNEIFQFGIVADIYKWVGFFSIFAFIINFLRELTKDIQDEIGDREMECRTVPIVLGLKWTKFIIIAIDLTLIGFIMYLIYGHHLFSEASLLVNYMIYAICGPLLFFSILISKAKSPIEYKIPQLVLKAVMLLGLIFSLLFAYTI